MNTNEEIENISLAMDNLFGRLADDSTQRVLELAAYEGIRNIEDIVNVNPSNVQRFLMNFAVQEADYTKPDGSPVWELRLSVIGDKVEELLKDAQACIVTYRDKVMPEDEREDLSEIRESLSSMVHFMYDYVEGKDETLNAIRIINDAVMDREFLESLEYAMSDGLKLVSEYSILCDDIAKESIHRHTLNHSSNEYESYTFDELDQISDDYEER